MHYYLLSKRKPKSIHVSRYLPQHFIFALPRPNDKVKNMAMLSRSVLCEMKYDHRESYFAFFFYDLILWAVAVLDISHKCFWSYKDNQQDKTINFYN